MNDHPKQPKWKREPDEDGFWWFKGTTEPEVVYVKGTEVRFAITDTRLENGTRMSGEWFGPLEPPSCFQDYPEET